MGSSGDGENPTKNTKASLPHSPSPQLQSPSLPHLPALSLRHSASTMLSLLRHAFVSLRRAPTVALGIVGTLGVALAATVLVFSFLNTFLLRPLPYGDASRLV